MTAPDTHATARVLYVARTGRDRPDNGYAGDQVRLSNLDSQIDPHSLVVQHAVTYGLDHRRYTGVHRELAQDITDMEIDR